MFDDLMVLAAREADKFSDFVRDSYGQSVLHEVYHPMNQNLLALHKLSEHYESQMNGIERELQEIRMLGSMLHE